MFKKNRELPYSCVDPCTDAIDNLFNKKHAKLVIILIAAVIAFAFNNVRERD